MAKKYLQLAAILKKLLFDRGMKAVDLARAIDLPPPTVHRLITGKSTRPYESSLKPIADYFAIDVEQLLGEKPLPGTEENDTNKTLTTNIKTKNIKLISWDKLQSFDSLPAEYKNTIPFLGKISDKGFATTMLDSSMEPLIQRHSILILDPMVEVRDRGFVLVKLYETSTYILRQILIDCEHKYLKPLNPDLSAFRMRLLSSSDEIVASLIEIRCNFQAQYGLEAERELKVE